MKDTIMDLVLRAYADLQLEGVVLGGGGLDNSNSPILMKKMEMEE